MTSTNKYWERTRDVQDGIERHLFVKQEYTKESGHYVNVKGTGSEDEEVPVIMSHVGFRLKDDTNSEVFLISGGSDTNMKFAFTAIPRDMQREWKKGRGGVQNPMNKDFALEFQKENLHVTKPTFSVGDEGVFQVKDGDVYIRGNLIVDKVLTANVEVRSPKYENGTKAPPSFNPDPDE